jgi:ribulose 1,5-bisphosphate carboxylase large subunit-like protein
MERMFLVHSNAHDALIPFSKCELSLIVTDKAARFFGVDDVGIGVDIKVAEIETYNWAPVVYRNGCFGLDINGSELYENRFIDFNELIKSWNENFFKESIVIANIWDNPDFVHEVKR